MADLALFDPPKEVTNISIEEIEAANPVLWEVNVPLGKLTQTHVKTRIPLTIYHILITIYLFPIAISEIAV